MVQQFKVANTKRLSMIKYPILVLVGFLILLIVFLLRDYFEHQVGIGTQKGEGFLQINVTTNPGVGFSLLKESSVWPYLLQGALVIIFLITFLFTANKTLLVLLPLILFGGLSNVIDRAIPIKVGSTLEYNSVLDYFQFLGTSAIFNFADICIVGGFVLIFLMMIFEFFVDFKKEKNKKSLNKQINGWKDLDATQREGWDKFENNKCVFCNYQLMIKEQKNIICSNESCSYIRLIDQAKPINVENSINCVICNHELIRKVDDKGFEFLACSRFNEGCYFTKKANFNDKNDDFIKKVNHQSPTENNNLSQQKTPDLDNKKTDQNNQETKSETTN
ncbi:signal peptidase II [Mycoplasma sp. E35C]|uniref:signal peptidase II n=1 Tax=Mycoplasma sp. E35C TaxID=2801918 RepID=UPI002105848A|nr:signal peptidase II [Mycoplasma sp. E35C]